VGKGGEYGANSVHMYVNGKVRPVQTVPRMGRAGGIKKNCGGMNSSVFVIL
jgi:hypothetical protein